LRYKSSLSTLDEQYLLEMEVKILFCGDSPGEVTEEVGDGTGKKILSSGIFQVNGLELKYFQCTSDSSSFHVERHC
jgi:hypothetical protein